MNARQIEELERLTEDAAGVLKPEAVVEFARDRKTALHARFEWDDTEAGKQYRIQQAREVIREWRVEGPLPDMTPRRVTVSVPTDREGEGGYRRVADVLNSSGTRRELVNEAIKHVLSLRNRLPFSCLPELEPLLNTIETAAKDFLASMDRTNPSKAKRKGQMEQQGAYA